MEQGMRQLIITIEGGPDTDAEELADLTDHFRRRLVEEYKVEAELIRSEEIPPRAKPIDAVTIGALAVIVMPSVLKSVVGLVEAWVRNRPVRSVTITLSGDSLVVTDASRADQHLLVQAFVEKHERIDGSSAQEK